MSDECSKWVYQEAMPFVTFRNVSLLSDALLVYDYSLFSCGTAELHEEFQSS